MRLYSITKESNSLLKENIKLNEINIKNDYVLYVVFRKEGCEDEEEGGEGLNDELWENVELVEVEE